MLPHALRWRYDSTDTARAHRAAALVARSQPSAAAAGQPAPAAPAIACLKQPTAADTGMDNWWSQASTALWDDVVSAHTQQPPGRKKCAARRLLSKHDVAKLLKHAAFVATVRTRTEACTDIMVLHASWIGDTADRHQCLACHLRSRSCCLPVRTKMSCLDTAAACRHLAILQGRKLHAPLLDPERALASASATSEVASFASASHADDVVTCARPAIRLLPVEVAHTAARAGCHA